MCARVDRQTLWFEFADACRCWFRCCIWEVGISRNQCSRQALQGRGRFRYGKVGGASLRGLGRGEGKRKGGRENSTRCCRYLADGPDSVCRPADRQTLCFELPDVSDSVYRPVGRQTFRFEMADVSDSMCKPSDRETLCFELPDVSGSVHIPVGRQTVCFELADVSESVCKPSD